MTDKRMGYSIPLLAGTTRGLPGDTCWSERTSGMDAWELHLTVKGCGRMSKAPDAAMALEGDFLLFPPGTPHVYGACPKEGWCYHWIYFHPVPDWQELLSAWPHWWGGIMRLHPGTELYQEMCRVFEKMIEASLQQHPRRLPLVLNYLENMLLRLDRVNPDSITTVTDERIKAAMKHISKHYSTPITVEELAGIACLSPSRFAIIFKEQVRETPIQCLERVRIEHAAELLLRSSSSVADIAEQTGYRCQFYFSRAFRHRTGLSPRDFRKRGGWPLQPPASL
jgi:AraC family transcriptional regulator, arabinose operon regulatory protein